MPWEPTTIVDEPWGRPQVFIGGVDVTFWRGKPTQLQGWTSNEPFGDATALIAVPQVSAFELPPWLKKWADVDIVLNRPDGTRKTLWEGLVASWEDGIDDNADSLVLECVGALYQADMHLKQPEFDDRPIDIGIAIYRELERLITNLGLRVNFPNKAFTGIPTTNRGGWNAVLTGYFQELLSNATTSVVFNDGEEFSDGIMPNADGSGYWIVGSLGSVVSFGRTEYYGSMYSIDLNKVATGVTSDGHGYWLVGEDGGVFAFGVPYHGSLNGTHPWTVVDIEYDSYSGGYWLCDEKGQIYTFGGARYHGGSPSLPTGGKIVDFAATADGGGYWMLSDTGAVYTFGNAPYHGGAGATGLTFSSIAALPGRNGYWLGAQTGQVFGYGDAVAVVANVTLPVVGELTDIKTWPGGGGYIAVSSGGGAYAMGTARYYGNILSGDGNVHQWTLMLDHGRRPVVRVKNRWTEHWSTRVGTPGVSYSLSRDFSMAPNVIYGEGIHGDCRWRNSKYPNLRVDTAPVWPGRYINIGMTGADVRAWEQEMHDSGHRGITVDGVYSQGDRNICMRFQAAAGMQVDGIVGPQTWAMTFETGSNAGDLSGAYMAPLAIRPEVEPFLYDPRGAIIGKNPAYDPTIVRVERYINFGNNVSKADAIRSAERQLAREHDAGWTGTITLKSDPVEGSRFDIHAGENIVLRSHRGEDRILHIASADIGLDDLTTNLTVDTHARDLLTVEGARSRDRENLDPARRQKVTYRNSKQIEDTRAVWDCENGSGVIPYHGVHAGLWNVLRIPCGERGLVVRAEFTAHTPTEFSVALFDRPITHQQLVRRMPSPLEYVNETEDPWDSFEEDTGLIIAWGGPGQEGGYYPRPRDLNTDPPPLTGRLVDNGNWYFESTMPPWVWVAIWCYDTTYFSGRLFPGFLD